MKKSSEQERIDLLRKRLYSRGEALEKPKRTELTDTKQDIPTTWQQPPKQPKKWKPAPVSTLSVPSAPHQDNVQRPTVPHTETSPASVPAEIKSNEPEQPMTATSKRKSYRMKLIGAALFFFVIAVVASSLYVIYGGRTISAENIAISLSGAFTIGGGEIMVLQVGITNQNTVPIDSATLIVEYPAGTQSADEKGTELFVERLALDSISSGETINIPLKSQVFGEENQELTVKAAVEYRIKGSNATFFKEAEPLRFKISSSPIVVSVDNTRVISSGQEASIDVTIRSNAPTTLNDILIKAEYPIGFDFSSSQPDPDAGQNIWIIETLEPEESQTITLKGIVIGSESDEQVMHFSVGVPNERDRFNLASVFAVASTEFEIEHPFLDVGIVVNDVRNDTAVIPSDGQSTVSVVITNTLDHSLYDGVVEVSISGNAFSDLAVTSKNGFYDSNTKKITWDISSIPGLEQISPGGSHSFEFTITPNIRTLRTPQVNIEATVKARRVSETDVPAETLGNVKSSIKIESVVKLSSATSFSANGLSGSGSVPPVVGKETSYILSLMLLNGSNNISDMIMSATLPSYVTWTDVTAGDGSLSYNPSTRVVEWKVDSINASAFTSASFEVSILPSTSQIGKTPTLLGGQRMRVTDDFTQTVLRATAPAITTFLPEETGFTEDDGPVRAN